MKMYHTLPKQNKCYKQIIFNPDVFSHAQTKQTIKNKYIQLKHIISNISFQTQANKNKINIKALSNETNECESNKQHKET